MTAASFIGFTGFTLAMPFLPLYFHELGVRDVGAAALWSGVSLGVTPAMTALLAPAWGRLADRFGSKIMFERSLVAFALSMAATTYATRPWHVLALRTVLGLFAGYGSLSITMAAQSAPGGRLASAIGAVQTAQRLGPAVGPAIGGLIAQLVGVRRAFAVSAIFYALAFVLVLVLYREPRTRRVDETADQRVTFRSLLALENLLLLMSVVFGLQFVDRSLGPILPLYVGQIGVPAARVALVSGLLFSAMAATGATGNLVCARLLRQFGARGVIGGGLAASAAATTMFPLTSNVWWLIVASLLFGLGIGMALTGAYTAAGAALPAGATGAGFGVIASASLAGMALSPIASGVLGATSIRGVFLLDVITLLVLAALTTRVMVEREPVAVKTPVVEEA